MPMSEEVKANNDARERHRELDYQAVVDEIIKLGYQASLQRGDWGRYIIKVEGGYSVYVAYDWQRERCSEIWSRKRGPAYITVGDFGNKKVFRSKKGSGFNYAAIAKAAMDDATQRKAKEDEYARKHHAVDVNSKAHEDFVAANQPPYTFSVRPSTDLSRPLSVEYRLKGDFTIEDAQRIFDILKQNNLLG